MIDKTKTRVRSKAKTLFLLRISIAPYCRRWLSSLRIWVIAIRSSFEACGFLNHRIITLVINYNSVGPWTQPAEPVEARRKRERERERALINEPSTRPSLFSSPTFTVQPTFHYSSYYKSLINFFQTFPPPHPSRDPLFARKKRKPTPFVSLLKIYLEKDRLSAVITITISYDRSKWITFKI